MSNLLVLGGTEPSKEIVEALLDQGVSPNVSVTQSSARELYPDLPENRLQVGPLDKDELENYLRTNDIRSVLDATHPYASKISSNATELCRGNGYGYMFYERPRKLPDNHQLLRRFRSWEQVSDYCENFRNVLLTIGVRNLDCFTPRSDSVRYQARILPRDRSIERAKECNFSDEQLITSWPPESAEEEEELIQERDIDALVTKESGEPGGVPQKWEAVKRSGITMVVVERPQIDYPDKTESLAEVVDWGLEHA